MRCLCNVSTEHRGSRVIGAFFTWCFCLLSRFALLLVLLLSVQQTHAHLPEYFGRRYVLQDAKPPEKPAARCADDDRKGARERADAMQQTVEENRQGQGVYGAGLADPLGELGQVYAELCNHPAALKNYREAIQRLRVNDGLLTKAQIPYLKGLADSSQAISDFRSAQMNYRYIFRIHGLGRGVLNQQAWDDSLAYFTRAREIFIDPRWVGDINLFFQAFSDNEAMLEVQLEREDLPYARLEELALSQLYNLYLILGSEQTQLQPNGPGIPGAASYLISGMQSLGYSKGIRLLENLMERAADQPDVVLGRLWLRLGNWHQWNGNWRRACSTYASAWPLAGGEEGASLREQMEQPAELPEDARIWRSLLLPDIPQRAIVDASYTVSARGSVSQISTDRVDEGSSALAGTIYRWLRDSHARPAIIDGQCASGTLVNRRYRLLP